VLTGQLEGVGEGVAVDVDVGATAAGKGVQEAASPIDALKVPSGHAVQLPTVPLPKYPTSQTHVVPAGRIVVDPVGQSVQGDLLHAFEYVATPQARHVPLK
jgi:hypothetical protein